MAKATATAQTAASAPIRITAPGPSFSETFTQILEDFTQAYPGVSFQFITANRMVDLMAGEADIALRFTREITDDRLIARKLTTVTTSLYAAPSYIARHGMPASEADLAGHKFVVLEGPTGQVQINRWLLDRIAPTQIVTRVTDWAAMLSVLKAGMGVGPLSTSMAFDHPQLVCCMTPPAWTYSWLVTSPKAYARPEVKAFLKFFAPRFKAAFAKMKAASEPA